MGRQLYLVINLKCLTSVPPERFEQRALALLDELMTYEDVVDPDIATNNEELVIHLQFGTVVASDEPDIDASIRALSYVRTALHVIGDGTPGWEKLQVEFKTEDRELAATC